MVKLRVVQPHAQITQLLVRRWRLELDLFLPTNAHSTALDFFSPRPSMSLGVLSYMQGDPTTGHIP